ncbi:hypothetical protein CHS0354_033872 [Potamilus streckersoni]|uniref:mRNA m(6)A methyltransferase n=1 Tax=Potamilus streckersoni TaxID=2493646 RepID=A0AAE0VKC3_9BIVA|nr:hypothetical protein CHS0354_033872 [Potamilus streckersoni]
MSDAWNEIQALKSKQSNLRAKLLARKREREGFEAAIGLNSKSVSPNSIAAASTSSTTVASSIVEKGSIDTSTASSRSTSPAPVPKVTKPEKPIIVDPEVEAKLLLVLGDIRLEFPASAALIAEQTTNMLGRDVDIELVENLLQKFGAQQMISITKVAAEKGRNKSEQLIINSVDLSKISAVATEHVEDKSKKRKREGDDNNGVPPAKHPRQQAPWKENKEKESIESLLSMQSAKEKENKKMTDEILQLLSKPTAKEQILVDRFKSQGGAQLQEFCQYGTRDECMKTSSSSEPCKKLHFRKIIHKHTDESLGDCSFLNTCFHMDTCKYVHYEIDYPENKNEVALLKKEASLATLKSVTGDSKDGQAYMYPPQWIQCDLRYLDMAVLGKCAVIMADPPWDIHMELPYGTMGDDEMRHLQLPFIQDDGYIFLWVTGRAMELGRECLETWGYKRVDEIIWVKTNQLQRIIRTGRTGHWLNHGKEHCLVGVKGNPKGVNKGLDCDVIVAEVRATSHKPDEIYGIIERLSPGTRKVELFGRPHNVQPNWITLGNQLEGVRLVDPDIVKRFREKYPDGNCMESPKNR